jgi:hypothetical protein
VRGDACEHPEALDLDAYLLSNAREGAKWECPLCRRARARAGMLLPANLWVDTAVEAALRSAGAGALAKRKLLLSPGGAWALEPPQGEAPPRAGGAAGGGGGDGGEGALALEEGGPLPWGPEALARIDAATAEAAQKAAAAQLQLARKERHAREAEGDVVDLTGLS